MLINNKTALAWYTEVESQNRYKAQCEASCNYQNLLHLNSVPPFQIYTGELGVTLVSWKIWCAADNTLLQDITALYGSYIDIHTTTSNGCFVEYDGTSMTSFLLECGTYYMSIETNTSVYYSELFEPKDLMSTGALSSPSELSMFTAWRFWDLYNKAERFKYQCLAECPYYLIVPNGQLLPFMFKFPHTTDTITHFFLYDMELSCQYLLEISNLTRVTIGAYDYIYFLGASFLDFPCGKYFVVVSVGANDYTSEPIDSVQITYTNPFAGYLQTDSGVNITDDSGVQITVD